MLCTTCILRIKLYVMRRIFWKLHSKPPPRAINILQASNGVYIIICMEKLRFQCEISGFLLKLRRIGAATSISFSFYCSERAQIIGFEPAFDFNHRIEIPGLEIWKSANDIVLLILQGFRTDDLSLGCSTDTQAMSPIWRVSIKYPKLLNSSFFLGLVYIFSSQLT